MTDATNSTGTATIVVHVIAPAALLAIATPFIDLPSAFLLASTMPAGLHIVVLAHIYGLDVPFAAGAITWTTMVAVPVLLVASVIV